VGRQHGNGDGSSLILFVALKHLARRDVRSAAPLLGARAGNAVSARPELVQLVAHTGAEFADQLHISHDTVRTHVRNAMTKLGARSRAHLVAKALGDGLVLA
jgi:ATP/maltotriose-dependent transcriptional regulator MalT